MQPHTGAVLCVVMSLLPDLLRQVDGSFKGIGQPIFFPYSHFSVRSTVPKNIHKQSSKTYSVAISQKVYNLNKIYLEIGVDFPCQTTIDFSTISKSEVRFKTVHNHSPSPEEEFRLYSDQIRGGYVSKIGKNNIYLRDQYLITVSRDVGVTHEIQGREVSKRSYPSGYAENEKWDRTAEINMNDILTKETNLARKFEGVYTYIIDSMW